MDTHSLDAIAIERCDKIRDVISIHGEGNFYISFSGGKDSCVLHRLMDEAIPGNTIPRVFFNTGIEYPHTVRFVREMAQSDERILTVNSHVNIRKTLEEHGYPFKSKEHSHKLEVFRTKGKWAKEVENYLFDFRSPYKCPSKLVFQFSDDYSLKISDKCCDYLKKKPSEAYQKESGRRFSITGIRRAEMGRRQRAQCTVFQHSTGRLLAFNPLVLCTDEWMDWYIATRGIQLSPLYYPPFSFIRTGCMGCPFALNLQEELDILKTAEPSVYHSCETIWKPVYDEYRRIGYRLNKNE